MLKCKEFEESFWIGTIADAWVNSEGISIHCSLNWLCWAAKDNYIIWKYSFWTRKNVWKKFYGKKFDFAR